MKTVIKAHTLLSSISIVAVQHGSKDQRLRIVLRRFCENRRDYETRDIPILKLPE